MQVATLVGDVGPDPYRYLLTQYEKLGDEMHPIEVVWAPLTFIPTTPWSTSRHGKGFSLFLAMPRADAKLSHASSPVEGMRVTTRCKRTVYTYLFVKRKKAVRKPYPGDESHTVYYGLLSPFMSSTRKPTGVRPLQEAMGATALFIVNLRC